MTTPKTMSEWLTTLAVAAVVAAGGGFGTLLISSSAGWWGSVQTQADIDRQVALLATTAQVAALDSKIGALRNDVLSVKDGHTAEVERLGREIAKRIRVQVELHLVKQYSSIGKREAKVIEQQSSAAQEKFEELLVAAHTIDEAENRTLRMFGVPR